MSSNNQLEHTQRQVQEVVGVMRNNIDRVLERDNKLNDLDYRASNLQAHSQVFQQSSRRLKKKYWWQNVKMMICIGVTVTVLIIILALIIYFSVGHSDGGDNSGGSGNKTIT